MKTTVSAVLNCFVIAAMLFGLAAYVQPVQAAPPTELFFSEYIKGSSNNKALEIYNGTGAVVNLASGGYNLQMYNNGSSSASVSFNLTGVVTDGDVYVVAHASANPTILAQADQTNGAGWYNGNDAVVLRKGTTIVDVIGQIGFNPGTEWGSGLVSTADNTLRRKDTICAGDPVGSDAFDPSLEWDGFANNTFDGLGAHVANCQPSTLEPKLNEFSASTTGADVEYVEIFGSPATDYSAYTVLEIEGDTTGAGVVDEVIAVGTTDVGGFWLGNLAANALENGTITLLLVKDFTGALNNDLDTNNDGVFDVTPWSAIVDTVAVNDGGAGDWTYGTTALSAYYDGLAYAPGGASRYPDGVDAEAVTDWVRNDFDLAGIPGYIGSIILGEAYNTPGKSNAIYVPPPEACGDPFTPIYAVQGNGLISPLADAEVAVEGIVVGDFQNNTAADDGNLNGFHIQDPIGDADASTSDGIFIYAPGAADVIVGDAVRVRGMVSEYNGMTEITVSKLWMCSAGNNVAPTPLSLPVTSLDDFEPYEGMLVTFSQMLYISEYFDFDRYGEIVLTPERQYQPTAVYEPGSPEAAALAQANLLSRITLDDGRTTQNPDPAIHPNGSVFNLTNLFRGGDTLQNVTGVLDYSFGLYRVQPTQGALYTVVNPRTAHPDPVGSNLKVASFNVLNYFTTLDGRGANDALEFTRQRDKIFAALAAMDADVVGLIEIENNGTAVQNLVEGLNNVMGAGTYAYVDTGVIGVDEITVAMIYKPATVSLMGSFAVLDDPSFTDPLGYGEQKSRPALAQTFMDKATGGVFTAAVNHFKSKGSSCGAGDDDPVQGNCNLTRTLGAQALTAWLATDPTGSGDGDFMIIGDLNSYDKEDPIDILLAGGYTDLLALYQGEYAYSYVFDGQLGYLDQALVNADLLDEVTGATAWHINADEPDLIDYDMTYKQDAQDALYASDPYRASDHDPVIVGMEVCDEVMPTLEVSVSPDTLWPANHKYVTVAATVVAVDNFDPNPTVTLVSVTSNEPDDGLGDGDTPNDIVILDDYTFQLRAERSGTGADRIYTITYQVVDACGNSAQVSATVTVPHDKRK